jgi:hypothetical protein
MGARPSAPIADRGQASATLVGPAGTNLYLFEKRAQ